MTTVVHPIISTFNNNIVRNHKVNLGNDCVLSLHSPYIDSKNNVWYDPAKHNNGSITGAIRPDNMKGLSFDGIDDYVNCGTGVINDPSAFTVSCWIKYGVDPATFKGMILTKTNFELYSRDYGAQLRFVTKTTAGDEFCYILFSAFDYTKWNFITGVYDGSTADIYLNGVYVDGDLQTGNILDTSTYDLEIGRKPGGTLHFNGYIDDVRLHNRALTTAEILTHFNSTKVRYGL